MIITTKALTVLPHSGLQTTHRSLLARLRHYFKNMLCPDLHPPATVRGMKQLDRSAFSKTIKVPHLLVPKDKNLNDICRASKKYLLKMERYKPVITEEYKITLHPLAVQKWEDLAELNLEKLDIGSEALVWEEIQLKYENWKYDEIFKAVLPADKEALSSFSKIGHIIHLNLKDHLLPYKELIGQVICDKITDCRTVVNKSLSIDNTYRNFQMELLCGEPDYRVSVKENGCLFEFDFSKVYWNPRLSTEHEKIVKMLAKTDTLFDLYAGVGPFTVPAARRGCKVLANDLNPDSYEALVNNCALNKVSKHVTCHNKDAVDFIKHEVKQALLEKCTDESMEGDIHITMNLPAMAVEHLVHFPGLLKGEDVVLRKQPLVHVYCFAKGVEDKKQIARELVEQWLGTDVTNKLKEIAFVRNVAPNKDMMRVSFYLTEDLLLGRTAVKKRQHEEEDSPQSEETKRPCNSNDNNKPTEQPLEQINSMAKKANKMKDQRKQLAKKAKTVFSVSQAKKGNLKKTKEVSSNLKKIQVNDKREKVDKKFEDLHAQIVSKKAAKPAPKPLPAKNKSKPDTKKIEADLNEMQM